MFRGDLYREALANRNFLVSSPGQALSDVVQSVAHMVAALEQWGAPEAYHKNMAIRLSMGAQVIARKDAGPVTALDPGIFFGELRKGGIEIHERVQEYHTIP